jgi:Ca2+-binding EF-hand superfamily protein
MEVEELMQELGLREGGGAGDNNEVSCSQLLDKLKLYQSERVADTAKCKQMFRQHDQDNSDFLDRDEIQQLAVHMGFGGKIQSDARFLDTMMSDIKKSRDGDAAGDAAAAQQADGDAASLDELLFWFLDTGRSYLPRRTYPAQPDLSDPTPQQLKQLFAAMDTDGSGQISAEEARAAIPTLWPYLDETEARIAFGVATARCEEGDGAASLGVDGVLVLLRCLIWLNRKRHSVEDVLHNFAADGVGMEEFQVGCRALGVLQDSGETEMAVTERFVHVCAQLQRKGQLVGAHMTAAQFVGWAVEHESVLPAQELQRLAYVAEELDARTGKYGDVSQALL